MGVPLRLILVPLGSWGDVSPFLWLGKALAERGHEVRVVINPPFGARIAAEALRIPLVTVQMQPAVFLWVPPPPGARPLPRLVRPEADRLAPADRPDPLPAVR